MLFNSYIFIFIFLPITFFIYFYLNKRNLVKEGKIVLVLSSLFFYSWWNIIYLPIILSSIIFNYIMGSKLSKFSTKKKKLSKKLLLMSGIISNLFLLGYFKYSDFFISNLNFFIEGDINLLNLTLPLAISFFTFQQIAYLVDSYKEGTQEYDFLNYAVFVSFFPQLIAGPIVHHKEMMPQFANTQNHFINYKNIALGIYIFSIGLFKKVVIADTFAVWATAGFDTATTLNFFEAWTTSLSYTFQLYFDFSGYTDMAIGLALFFNIKLPINFNSPYKATNIQDFWRRWHITLSRFLRDYIYIPLGGNRKSNLRTYSNIMATFILGGIWHGAGWTFIFWGFLHGMAMAVHRIWSNLGYKLSTWAAWLLTFNFINITWIFFRAKEWDDAMKVLGGMFNLNNIVFPQILFNELSFLADYGIKFGKLLGNINGVVLTPLWIISGIFFILLFSNSIKKLETFKPNFLSVVFTSIILFIGILSITQESEFLYFNF